MEVHQRDSYSRVSEDIHRVEVPEHVEISFTLAGFGSRLIAYLVDLAFMFVLVVFLFGAMITLFVIFQKGIFESMFKNPAPSAQGLIFAFIISLFGIALFVVSWFYFVVFEMLWDGRSPGKRFMALRVIRDEGGRISFYTSLLRNLLRVADWLPGFYLAGIITMFANKKWKRLGDIAAGTIVVKEEKVQWVPSRSTLPPAPHAQEGQAAGIESLFSSDMLERLGKDYYNLCCNYLKRRHLIDPYRAFEVAKAIAHEPMARLNVSGIQYDSFIEAFVIAWQERKKG